MRVGLGIGLGRQAINPAWNPLKLSGLLGGWDFTPATAFSDSGLLVPCVDGDGVQKLKAISGPTLTQATAGSRPIFRMGNYADFDGSRSFGLLATGAPAGLFSYHRFRTSTLGYHNIYDTPDFGTNSKAVMLWVDAGGQLEPDAQGLGIWGSGPVVTDGLWHTAFVYRSATVATRMWVDGTEITPGIGAVAKTIPDNIDVFSRGGVAGFNGSAKRFGFATALPSNSDLIHLQNYLVG